MAITAAPHPRLVLDAESERSSEWDEGTEVYCKDTGYYYQMIGGSWVLKGLSLSAFKSLIQASITDGTIPIILNGKQLAIDGATGVVTGETPA